MTAAGRNQSGHAAVIIEQITAENAIFHFYDNKPGEKLQDISSVIKKHIANTKLLEQPNILTAISRLWKSGLHEWKSPTIFTLPFPAKASNPNEISDLRIVKFSKKIIFRVSLKIQMDERYKIRKTIAPSRKSFKKIAERMRDKHNLRVVNIDEKFTDVFVLSGSYRQKKCDQCKGSGTECSNCGGYGYLDDYVEKVRNVYTRLTPFYWQVFQNNKISDTDGDFSLPNKNWKILWQVEQEKPFEFLPFTLDNATEQVVNEIKEKFKNELREVFIYVKEGKISDRYADVSNSLYMLEMALDKVSAAFSHPEIFSPDGEGIFVNQYLCVLESVAVYELSYERPFTYSMNLLGWKTEKNGIIKGNLLIQDGEKSLEIFSQNENLQKWLT